MNYNTGGQMGFHNYFVKTFNKVIGKSDIKRLNSKTPVEGIKVNSDIPYTSSGNKFHLLDVYSPVDNLGTLPIIIDIHGGAWIYGTKDINKHYCMTLASQGFVVVNLSYRLISEGSDGTFPKILEDVFSAFNWVEENIKSYNGDKNNVFLTGDSAGAHLACLALSVLTTKNFASKLNVHTDLHFRACALTCGVANIESLGKLPLPIIKYFFKLFLGNNYKKSGYLSHLTIKNNNIEDFPPMFLNTTDGDFMKKQVLGFYEELRKRCQSEVELCYIKKPTKNKLIHVYNVLFPEYEESLTTNNALIAFFKKYIKI